MGHISVRGEQSTSAEIAALTNLAALATSAAGEFIRKTGPTTFANATPSGGTGFATTALDNLSAVAINAALVLATNDAFALGSATKSWSDLFLASGAVINFNNGNMTITHSAGNLTIAGGTFTVPTSGLIINATTVISTGTQLNYLSAATGTTGTTSTNVVFSTSPTLVTPVLGVATATSINKVLITAPTTSATLTIADGKTLTVSNTMTLAAGADGQTFTFPSAGGTVTVLGNTTTGTGSIVLATSPTLVTPVLGVASATTINKVTITAPATGSTLTIVDGKTLTASNTLTFTGTDGSSAAFGTGGTVVYTSNNLSVFAATTSAQLAGVISDETGSGVLVFGTTPTFTTSMLLTTGFVFNFASSNVVLTHSSAILTLSTGTLKIANPTNTTTSVVTVDATQTLSNKRVTPMSATTTSSGTPTINTDTTDIFTITALAVAITSFTTNLSGTPTVGQKLIIRILDNGTARAITWGTSFASRGGTLPTTTVISKYLYVGLIWNATTSTWDCVATSQEA